MRVTIAFHGPFRVATGVARPGLDATVDHGDYLPASSLKGLMRDSAERLAPGGLANAVFGTNRAPTAWAWNPVVFDEEPRVRERGRVALADSGAARKRHLLFGEEVWARTAHFTIEQYAALPENGLTLEDHLTVLACAAAGVHSLGSGRRRGLGWVRFTPSEPAVDHALITRFRALAESWRQDA